MLKWRILSLALVLLLSGAARADSLHGTYKYQDGSKVNGKVTISTSWNSKKVSANNGTYRLDFGGPVERVITVYVNRKRYKIILVRGATRLNIVLMKEGPPSGKP